MALQDLIRKNKGKVLTRGAGGVLEEQKPESVQTLAQKAGLPAAPITPLGAGMIGANQDQQKMVGTPVQKQAALTLGQQPQNELATATRQEQSRTEQTTGEKAEVEKSEAMKNLGSLGQRVTDFIQVQRDKLTAQAQPTSQALAAESVDVWQGKDLSSIKPALAALRANPNDMQALLQVNQALGYNINTQLSPDQINELYESSVDSISRGAAGNVDNDLTLQDLIDQGNLGYTPQQLSELLNIPEAELGGMSVGQLRDTINKVSDEEFRQAEVNKQQAINPNAGAAEREQARKLGREISTTGVRTAEADVQKIEQAIANADEVQFAGQNYKVEDLLKDETISGLVTDYLKAAPDSEFRRQMEASEPQLIDFIKQHEALLKSASEQLSAGATEFQSVQTSNKSLANMGGVDLDTNLAKSLIPGYGELQAERVNPEDVPALAHAQGLNDAGKARMASELNAQMASSPSLSDEIQDLTPEEWNKLNVEGNGPSWQSYKSIKEQNRKAVQAVDPDEISQQLFSDVSSLKDVQRAVTDSKFLNIIGAKGGLGKGATSLADRNKDGEVTQQELYETNLNKNSDRSLREVLDEGYKPYQREQLGTVYMDSLSKGIQKGVKGMWDDGYLDKKEIEKSKLSWEELQFMAKKSPDKSIDKDALGHRIKRWQNETAAKYINKTSSDKGRKEPVWKQIDALEAGIRAEKDQVNKEDMEDRIYRLQALQDAGYKTEQDYLSSWDNLEVGQSGGYVPEYELGKMSKKERKKVEDQFKKAMEDQKNSGKNPDKDVPVGTAVGVEEDKAPPPKKKAAKKKAKKKEDTEDGTIIATTSTG